MAVVVIGDPAPLSLSSVYVCFSSCRVGSLIALCSLLPGSARTASLGGHELAIAPSLVAKSWGGPRRMNLLFCRVGFSLLPEPCCHPKFVTDDCGRALVRVGCAVILVDWIGLGCSYLDWLA
ncbi:hypothetical protein BS78_05G037700 [Paspalum vaginatum]|nr:hypothetical protein BS78_05G037700 [Paspalum vaginatum]